MTLQASGSMTIAEINTELGRSSGAALTPDGDEQFTAMAEASDFIIPDDLYGKSSPGTFQGEYIVTVGAWNSNTSIGFGAAGSIDSTSYRSKTITSIHSQSTRTYCEVIDASYNSLLVTAIYNVTKEKLIYITSSSDFTPSSSDLFRSDIGAEFSMFELADVGQNHTIWLFGD